MKRGLLAYGLLLVFIVAGCTRPEVRLEALVACEPEAREESPLGIEDGVVHLLVVDAAGRPVPSVPVHVSWAPGLTDENGRVTLEIPAPDPWMYRCSSPPAGAPLAGFGFPCVFEGVSLLGMVGSDTVTLLMPPTGSLLVHVHPSLNMEELTVMGLGAGGSSGVSQKLNEQGRAHFPVVGLRETHNLHWRAPGHDNPSFAKVPGPTYAGEMVEVFLGWPDTGE